jgi:hypothetical protein
MNTNWLMLAVVLLGLVLAWIAGRQGAESMLERESLLADLAPKIIATPEFIKSLDRSAALGDELDDRLLALLSDDLVAQNLVSQSGIVSELDASIQQSLSDGFGRTVIADAVASAVKKATPAVGSKAAKSVDSAQVERLRRVMQGYEGRLATLATQVDDDESAIAVNGLQGQLFEMQTLLTGLSQEVRCVVANGGSTRNFLLKERRSTPLSGVNLLVSLGRLKKGVLNTVSISSHNPTAGPGEAASTTAVKGNVSIGKPFNFDANGRAYEGTFTFSQGRWGPDFVGFEMRDIGLMGAANPDC